MGSLKTDERITKTSDDGFDAKAGRPGRKWLKIVLALAVILALVGAGYYTYLHRPTSEAEVAEIASLVAAGKDEEARALMVDAQVRSKDVDALRLRIGRAFLHEGKVGPATALLSKVESLLIKEERLAIAEYFLVSGDPFSAVRFYEAALRTGMPRTASFLGRYGEALALSSNGEGAVAVFKESLALDPSKVRIRVNLATTLGNLGQLDEAMQEALAVLKIDPENEKAKTLLEALGAKP
jgi:thioredoxin-like negative regulator of GroEL